MQKERTRAAQDSKSMGKQDKNRGEGKEEKEKHQKNRGESREKVQKRKKLCDYEQEKEDQPRGEMGVSMQAKFEENDGSPFDAMSGNLIKKEYISD